MNDEETIRVMHHVGVDDDDAKKICFIKKYQVKRQIFGESVMVCGGEI
jgi:hypothetical protein